MGYYGGQLSLDLSFQARIPLALSNRKEGAAYATPATSVLSIASRAASSALASSVLGDQPVEFGLGGGALAAGEAATVQLRSKHLDFVIEVDHRTLRR
jgi:hypothetical protein